MKKVYFTKIEFLFSKLYLLCLYASGILITNTAYAQNLIANPSLEDQNFCEENVPCCPAAWYPVSAYPTGYENDFYQAYSGKKMIGFFIWTKEGVKTYWQTKLLCPLQHGKMYQLSFYLYSPVAGFKDNYFGAYFSYNKIASTTDTVLQFNNYLPVTTQHITATDTKSKWLKVKLSFTATGTEKYLILGNFNNQNQTEEIPPPLSKYVKYFADDISLFPLDNSIHACREYKYNKDSLYKANIRHLFHNNNATSSPAIPVDTAVTVESSIPDTLILSNINFDFDSYKLTNTSTIAAYFKNIQPTNIAAIEVLGYTDSIGTCSYNNQLSQKRADAVKNILLNTYSFKNSQITAIGKGISSNKAETALNRRVEIIIHKQL